MSRTSILERSLSAAAAVLAALLSPANATCRQDSSRFPRSVDQRRHRSCADCVDPRLPWLAPVGHRQPHQADVPPHEAVSMEHQQQRVDQELDRKLIVCRGC
jgi:hypothetical protein